MSPKKRYLAAIFFWAVSLLVLFVIRKAFLPERVEGHALLFLQIPAAGVCFLVGLIRVLDTAYNCVNGIVICVYPTRPMEVVHFKVTPLLFVFGLIFEAFIWVMLMVMTWPLLRDSITKL